MLYGIPVDIQPLGINFMRHYILFSSLFEFQVLDSLRFASKLHHFPTCHQSSQVCCRKVWYASEPLQGNMEVAKMPSKGYHAAHSARG